MVRLLAMSALALVVSCAGAMPPAAQPAAQRVQGAPTFHQAMPFGIETPVVAFPTQPSAMTIESRWETAPTPAAPTWSWIFARYFAVGTEGGCGRSHSCHAPEMAQASSAYDWLEQRGYIAGLKSPIASASNSCLRWFGGNMPPRGKPNEEAARDVSAWVAAGAPND